MQALIGDLSQPLPRLSIHILFIGDSRSSILPKVSDGAFDFPFFRLLAGLQACGTKGYSRSEAQVFAEKVTRRPSRRNGGGDIVVSEIARHPTHRGEARDAQ